jgi:cytoskeletal protein RodZ
MFPPFPRPEERALRNNSPDLPLSTFKLALPRQRKRKITMSAPNTNLEKQRRRHRGPLIGIVLVILFVGVILVWWLGDEFSMSENPGSTTLDPATASQSVGAADEGSLPTEVDPLTNEDAAVTPDATVPLSPDAPTPEAAAPLEPATDPATAPAPAPVD